MDAGESPIIEGGGLDSDQLLALYRQVDEVAKTAIGIEAVWLGLDRNLLTPGRTAAESYVAQEIHLALADALAMLRAGLLG